MHRIQQHILKELILHPERRYSEIKPDSVESNLFVYHLRQLIKEGLVVKLESGQYHLTETGQSYVDRLSLETLQPRLQPRIVTLIVLQDDRGNYLLYRRKRQPLTGMVGFPYGKIHTGETVAEAASRELKEKTGLGAELLHCGDGYTTINQNGQTVSQIMFHLFVGSNPVGQLKAKTAVGEAFWGDPTQVPGWELMPSVIDIIEATRPPERFFFEKTYQLEAPTA